MIKNYRIFIIFNLVLVFFLLFVLEYYYFSLTLQEFLYIHQKIETQKITLTETQIKISKLKDYQKILAETQQKYQELSDFFPKPKLLYNIVNISKSTGLQILSVSPALSNMVFEGTYQQFLDVLQKINQLNSFINFSHIILSRKNSVNITTPVDIQQNNPNADILVICLSTG